MGVHHATHAVSAVCQAEHLSRVRAGTGDALEHATAVVLGAAKLCQNIVARRLAGGWWRDGLAKLDFVFGTAAGAESM